MNRPSLFLPSRLARISLLLAVVFCHLPARAAQVVSLSPQGEVSRVRQVLVKFDEAMVPLGNPDAPAPLLLNCDPAEVLKGQGRWLDEKSWAFNFAEDLPAATNCKLRMTSGLKSVAGNAYQGQRDFQFDTGGPAIRSLRPWAGSQISEDQAFVLQLTGPASKESLTQHLYCEADDLGEQIPVTLVTGEQRNLILKGFGWQKGAAKEPDRYWVAQCTRRFSPSIAMRLVYDQGVASPQGVVYRHREVTNYSVRAPFQAEFSCTRGKAQAACMPLDSMRLSFNAPLSIALARQIALVAQDGTTFYSHLATDSRQDDSVQYLEFSGPFAEKASFQIRLPEKMKDDADRPLDNANAFPLTVKTDVMPTLLKFATAPFGVAERFAEPDGIARVPVTVRNVEYDLDLKDLGFSGSPGKVADLTLQDDAEILKWIKLLDDTRYLSIDRDTLLKLAPNAVLPDWIPHADDDVYSLPSQEISLLAKESKARHISLPDTRPDHNRPLRPFEVIGIPLKTPGYHVLEASSPALGRALLNDDKGPRTMYVRTGVLVTNLSVHIKQGQANTLVWVTRLNDGKPVPDADVRVSSCEGEEHARGTTDQDGLWRYDGELPTRYCSGPIGSLFVTARVKDPSAPDGMDMAFAGSGWENGIESWRFGYPTGSQSKPQQAASTVVDRTLLRAGEKVSMKHFIRTLTMNGFALYKESLPDKVIITHVGSGQETTQPLQWQQANEGLSASSNFDIPKNAKLGEYDVSLGNSAPGKRWFYNTGSFRVEEFRLPVFQGSINLAGKQSDSPLVQPRKLPLGLQVNYLSGGGASSLPVKVSAALRTVSPTFDDYDSFSFAPPHLAEEQNANSDDEYYGEDEYTEEQQSDADSRQRLIADKLPLILDGNGSGSLELKDLPAVTRPQDLLIEAGFADPNGEIVTLGRTLRLWPATVMAAVRRPDGPAIPGHDVKLQALALGVDGAPKAGIALQISVRQRQVTSTRRRIVGGFYAYDSQVSYKDLGTLCSGRSDAQGLLECSHAFADTGDLELLARATDAQGNATEAVTSLWVRSEKDIWFGGSDSDRIDLLPQQKNYRPGDTAEFQVRMPFRKATALVTVEREGILESHVIPLSGENPTFSLKIGKSWEPNVFVSALVIRGRIRSADGYEDLGWGKDGRELQPTALIDLSKPAYRLGVANIKVMGDEHALQVKVQTDQPKYHIRATVKAHIKVQLPDDTPAAGADVALAAVDEALLELKNNTSWNLLEAMMVPRTWSVQTATAQMQVIGRRHYGRKALPPGGSGGGGPTLRELFDTLLLWKDQVTLDANGEAEVQIPLNDSLTSFRIVAVAAEGSQRFGTGSTRIRTSQDLQLISGLPPVVRVDDDYRAAVTLRNASDTPLQVTVQAKAGETALDTQTLDIPADGAREAVWQMRVTPEQADQFAGKLDWVFEASASGESADTPSDKLKVSQRVLTAVPVTVRQAALKRVDGTLELPVAPPEQALTGRGGLKISLVPRLAEGLPAIRDWFTSYPYSCLEQLASIALGKRDPKAWRILMRKLPNYLDDDGLAYYYPLSVNMTHRGSDVLTAYLLASSDEAARLQPQLAMPDDLRNRMLDGLTRFVEGRIQRDYWSPRQDLEMRKLIALEALSRFNRVQPRMLDSINLLPNQWPTASVIDWLQILQRTPDIAKRDERLAEADQILRSRLTASGTHMGFSTEKSDYWWWLMWNADLDAARLLLTHMDDPAWKDELPQLVTGFISRQHNGTWHTTVSNLWGGMALERFSRAFESEPVSGKTQVQLQAAAATRQGEVDWSNVERIAGEDTLGNMLTGPAAAFGAPSSAEAFRNNKVFLNWPTAEAAGTSGHKTSDGTGGSKMKLQLTQVGTGKPWATIQSLAAVPLKAPYNAGYSVTKTLTPQDQQVKGQMSRGDIWKVSLYVKAQTDMTWVVLNDPIPAGATILGSGLGRDSTIAQGALDKPAADNAWLAYQERAQDGYRAYYEYVPKGEFSIEYLIRLNNEGSFALPPTRVEALYAPEVFGETPNETVTVVPVAKP